MRSCRTSRTLPAPIWASSPKRSQCRFSRQRITQWADSRPTSMGRLFGMHLATRFRAFTPLVRIACVSVHGANRLGTNSLVDLVVFGRRAGEDMLEYVKTAEFARVATGARSVSHGRSVCELSVAAKGRDYCRNSATGNARDDDGQGVRCP